MNWAASIHKILGKFWSWLFEDVDFVLGVQNIHTFIGKEIEQKLKNRLSINDIDDKSPECDYLPRPLLLDISKIHRSYYSIDDVLAENSTHGFEEETSNNEWVVSLASPTDNPYMLTDHVTNSRVVMLRGLDFECKRNELLLRVDPASLNLTKRKLVVDGGLRIYYILWAWYKRDTPEKDAVAAMIAPLSGSCAEAAWRMRHEGATIYNTKALLAKVSDSVVSDNDGIVEDIWQEQNYRHMLISGKVYSAPAAWTVRKVSGASVVKGDILFGDLQFFSGPDIPSPNIVPGIPVMTDVGGMVAANTSATVTDNVLPLTGNNAIVSEYIAESLLRNADPNCPKHTITTDSSGKINVLQYVTQTVRRGRSCIAVLSADTTAQVVPAIRALRDNTCASAIVDVVIHAKTEESFDPLELQATATVGNAAIATSVTPLVAENSVSAEIWQ